MNTIEALGCPLTGPSLAAGPLESGVIIPAAAQLLRYFYLPLEFLFCSPLRSPL